MGRVVVAVRLTAVIVVASVITTASLAARQTPPVHGPWIGTWKFNAERTAVANGRPKPAAPPATATIFRMVAPRDDVFKYTIESMPAEGTAPSVRAELIGRFDGRDYIEIGNPGADTNRFRIINSRTYEVVDTKDGKDLLTIRITISEDGQTRTSVAKGVNVRGEPVHTISVYDRVSK